MSIWPRLDGKGKDCNVLLLPGQLFVGDARYTIRTLLGSCVSITLWQPQRRIGAMSHYMLGRNLHPGTPLSGRYGEDALVLMLTQLTALGVVAQECQAKIFGGGEMFFRQKRGVGWENGQAAHRMLQQHGIAIVSESLFGEGHRNILFDVSNGDVWSRQVNPGVAIRPASRRTHVQD